MIKIPLKLLNLHDDGFHLMVEVVVSGEKFQAIIDTGASKTVFDKTAVIELFNEDSLIITEQLSTGLGTNSMESFKIKFDHILIGNLSIQNFEAAVLDLSAIKLAYEKLDLPQIIGVIGGDILLNYAAIIDYGDCTLTLTAFAQPIQAQ